MNPMSSFLSHLLTENEKFLRRLTFRDLAPSGVGRHPS